MTALYQQTALEITGDQLKEGERLQLQVNGTSMAPFLQPGDGVIVLKSAPEGLARGDLVVALRERDLVTHRLVAIENALWYLKGDNLPGIDLPLPAGAIFGRVIAVQRKDTIISLETTRWRLVNRILGWSGRSQMILFDVLERFKVKLFGQQSPGWNSRLARFAALPFRILVRLLTL
jgi:hypothetical protein